MAKSKERIEARKLRRKGWSNKEIREKLGVSKASVSVWCRDIKVKPGNVKFRNFCRTNKGRLKAASNRVKERIKRRRRFMLKGKRELSLTDDKVLLAVGAALYWAEGYKAGRRVIFCNSDPAMIKLFLIWLRRICGVALDRIRCVVGINEIHAERIDDVIKYWVNVTGISEVQFGKTSYKRVVNKKFYKNFNNHYGTLTIKVLRGTNLFYQIEGYLQALGDMAG